MKIVVTEQYNAYKAVKEIVLCANDAAPAQSIFAFFLVSFLRTGIQFQRLQHRRLTFTWFQEKNFR